MMKYGRLSSLMSLLLLAACAVSPEPDPAGELYLALGEREGIERFVEETLIRVSDDVRIAHHFRGIPLGDLRDDLTEQFCELAGGPCDYTGRDMIEAHEDMNISRSEFNALVEHLIAAMDRSQVPVPAQNRLIAKLAPMQRDIVQ